MKIRIIQAGSENFTGDFGPVPFENGVSTRDVTNVEAQRLAGIIAVETVEDTPRNPSMAQVIIDTHETPMHSEMLSTAHKSIQDPVKKYTEGELMAIADKDGIAGLRPIGASMHVKSNSIRGLIEAILKAQNGPSEPEKTESSLAKNETTRVELPAAPAPAAAAEAPADPFDVEPA